MEIREGGLDLPEVVHFLREHLEDMRRNTPPESIHALDLEGLRSEAVTFWTLWDGGCLAGCGALKQIDPRHGEIKSMRTSEAARRRGIASRLLQYMVIEARRRGYRRLSLETGAIDQFAPARAFYARHGFRPCGPFGSYGEDPNSVFMTLELP